MFQMAKQKDGVLKKSSSVSKCRKPESRARAALMASAEGFLLFSFDSTLREFSMICLDCLLTSLRLTGPSSHMIHSLRNEWTNGKRQMPTVVDELSRNTIKSHRIQILLKQLSSDAFSLILRTGIHKVSLVSILLVLRFSC